MRPSNNALDCQGFILRVASTRTSTTIRSKPAEGVGEGVGEGG
ncbi:MAG: hypothetical protein ABGY24_05970 [bacterium]